MTGTTQESSLERIAWDHAVLAEGLSARVSALEDARLDHWNVGASLDELGTFLSSAVTPYEHGEETRLYGASGASSPAGLLGSRLGASNRKRIREHGLLFDAANRASHPRTALDAVILARWAQSLYEAHIAHEDAQLIAADRSMRNLSRTGGGPVAPAGWERAPREVGAGLALCLANAITGKHEWLARRLTALPQASQHDQAGQLALCERIIVALSRHTSLMIQHLYPVADEVLPRSERAVTRQLSADLRKAERVTLRIEGILRGDSLEHPADFADLWSRLTELSSAHAAEEEALIHRLGQQMPVDQAIALLTDLRRGTRSAPTRPHPSAAHPGRLGRAASRINARFDRLQDVFDSRSN